MRKYCNVHSHCGTLTPWVGWVFCFLYINVCILMALAVGPYDPSMFFTLSLLLLFTPLLYTYPRWFLFEVGGWDREAFLWGEPSRNELRASVVSGPSRHESWQLVDYLLLFHWIGRFCCGCRTSIRETLRRDIHRWCLTQWASLGLSLVSCLVSCCVARELLFSLTLRSILPSRPHAMMLAASHLKGGRVFILGGDLVMSWWFFLSLISLVELSKDGLRFSVFGRLTEWSASSSLSFCLFCLWIVFSSPSGFCKIAKLLLSVKGDCMRGKLCLCFDFSAYFFLFSGGISALDFFCLVCARG